MAGTVLPAIPVEAERAAATKPRHPAWVRITHWLTALAFLVLLFSGIMMILTHPRFYWGETGNVTMKPLFSLHIPSSRDTVPTGYGYVLADENGWNRALHFQTAWLLVVTALVYGIAGFLTGHFRRNLVPLRGTRNLRAHAQRIAQYLRRQKPDAAEAHSYNVLQRTTYLTVIFVLFPLIIWTGLALSPAFDSAFPWAVNIFGGRQSARTLHFFLTIAITLFFLVHVIMVAVSGFRSRMRSIIAGNPNPPENPQ